MTAAWIGALVGYLAVAAFAWTRIFEWLYRSFGRDHPRLTWDDGDRMFAVAWGGMVALGWPISAPIFAGGWLIKRSSKTGVLAAICGGMERRLDES